MTRPQIIRADTIDLQDHGAPSAKDHTRQPTHPAPLGIGPPAPHQAGAIRQAEEASEKQQLHSIPVSDDHVDRENSSLHEEIGSRGGQADQDGWNGQIDQDEQAVRLNGGHIEAASDDAEVSDLEGDDSLDDDMMDKLSSSPSIDEEDIDFKFVYALHNFFATVEGQANATKGDTMVLLDDSNSYWWLVRVVKDSSIGYLPAEHIETPTERLARLNKHRNIDLSATMLSDNTEKSKNPLKKAMRRRNAKTVQFCAPTYFEASDVEYSSDEEDGEADPYLNEGESPEAQAQAQANGGQQDEDATAAEAVKLNRSPKDSGVDDIRQLHSPVENGAGEISTQAELSSSNDEISDPHATVEDVMNGKSRRGTVRNTDSFFKDDSVETRKITLTPNILRDESSNSTIRSNESKELKTRTSFDTLEKTISPTERSKEDRKKKDKKPGMLSGLFKRKDKKSKSQDDEADDSEKVSGEFSRLSPQPKGSLEALRQEAQSSRPAQQPQRHPSKLQKAPPGVLGPAKSEQPASQSTPISLAGIVQPPPDRPAPTANAAASSMRVVSPDIERRMEDTPAPLRIRSPEQPREPTIAPTQPEPKSSGGIFSPITSVLRSSPSSSDPKPEKAKKSKRRVAMDDFDSSPDAEEPSDPLEEPQHVSPEHTSPEHAVQAVNERLSESPIQVSPVDPEAARPPPALMVDTSSQEEPSLSQPSSPELIEAPETKPSDITPTSTVHSQPPVAAPTWSDASLRTYLEDDSEFRDLLVVVHDKSGVVPAGPDHPITGGLFKEENRRLGELSARLDNMLGDWLARKSKLTLP